MNYSDQNLLCSDCGKSFVWTAGEQDFYAKQSFQAPRRCPTCRATRKREKQGQVGGRNY